MTDAEFKRYERAVELREKIERLQREIESLENNFDKEVYPRSETDWKLCITINDAPKTVSLTSDLFWECMELIEHRKQEELFKLQEQFSQL